MKRWIFILSFFSISAYAQELDLKTAIEEALHHSPVVQRAHAQVQEAKWKKIESYSGLLPTFSADANYLFSKKYALIDVDFSGAVNTIPQIIPTSQLILTGSIPIFDGMSNINHMRAGSWQYEAVQNESDWTEFSIRMQTILFFYKTLASKNLMEVAIQNEKTIQDHYKDVVNLQKVGVATKFDVLRVGVQVNEAEAEVLKSSDEYEFSKIRLANVMGKESDVRVPYGEFPNLKPDLVASAPDKLERKDIQAMSEQSKSLSLIYQSNNKFWVPKLSIFGQLQAYNNINDEFSDWDAYREAYQVGFNLHWNIFDGAVSISKSKQSHAQAIASQNNVRIASLQASEDAEIWKKKYLYFCKIMDVKNSQTQKAQEAVRLANESVRAGTKTNSDLIDAELDLFRSRADVLNAHMGLVEALINYQMATGNQVYDF